MAEPIVFISHNRVKKGMFSDFKSHYQKSIPITEVDKPSTVVQLAYANKDETEVAIVRLFPDAEALDLQLRGADERSKITYQFIEPTGIEIYGTPNEFALEMMKKVAGSGIVVRIFPDFTGGFIRPQPG
ncbi:MAG: hypothetical protein A2029_06455 [Chloroflexi bacterium RBG_19FT_COMBO_47_9]|nr:MAG: hypothetical protein A2029_06455 [Chloroflexi bacterium RBG_19FT_COMBO_47_9]